MLNFVLLLLACQAIIASQYIDVTAPERYATVLNTENYILPTGLPTGDPPQFYGIFYVAVINNGTSLQITGVHQVGFATMVAIYGPAAVGQYSANIVSILATGNAQSTAVPVQHTFPVTAQTLEYLRQGMLFVQVTSDGKTSGQIRGNFVPSTQNLVNFISIETAGYKADFGMALINADDIRNQPDNVGLIYFILSTLQSGLWVGVNLQGTQTVTFGSIVSGGVNMTAVFTPFATPPVRVSVPRSDVVACSFYNGALNASYSPLVLTLVQNLLFDEFQPFIQTTAAPTGA